MPEFPHDEKQTELVNMLTKGLVQYEKALKATGLKTKWSNFLLRAVLRVAFTHGKRTTHSKTGVFGPVQHGAELGQICSNDTASAATASSYRYQARVRELEQRFEIELQGVRDAFLQDLASLDLVEGQ